MTDIEKHEKSIRILQNIDSVNKRIVRNELTASKIMYGSFGDLKEHYLSRIEIDKKIKQKLINYYNMSAQEQLSEQYRQQIDALQKENQRLNDELKKVKYVALKLQLSDPNFDKPINEIEVNYGV